MACITLLNNRSSTHTVYVSDSWTPVQQQQLSSGPSGSCFCCWSAAHAQLCTPRQLWRLSCGCWGHCTGKKKYIDSLHYTASILNSHVIGDSNSLCVSPTALRSVNKPHPNILRHGRPVQSAEVTWLTYRLRLYFSCNVVNVSFSVL